MFHHQTQWFDRLYQLLQPLYLYCGLHAFLFVTENIVGTFFLTGFGQFSDVFSGENVRLNDRILSTMELSPQIL